MTITAYTKTGKSIVIDSDDISKEYREQLTQIQTLFGMLAEKESRFFNRIVYNFGNGYEMEFRKVDL